jgi:hypothetical protein
MFFRWFPIPTAWRRAAGNDPSLPGRRRRKCRRGATAMEYLVCLSFIIGVLILAVQHVGNITKSIAKNDADNLPVGTTSN